MPSDYERGAEAMRSHAIRACMELRDSTKDGRARNCYALAAEEIRHEHISPPPPEER